MDMMNQDNLAYPPLRPKIRKAGAEDAAVAWEIRNAAISNQCKGYYAAELIAIWANGEFDEEFLRFVVEHVYVATIDEVVVGIGAIDCKTGRVDALFVRPELMSRGIGKQMISFLEDLGRASGLTELTLDSTLNAAEFYRSCGFVGDVMGTYHSPRGLTLDCIPMKKSLR